MKRNLWEKMGDFVLGKGFYIVLFLCVATIGISGYYLIRSANESSGQLLEPVTGNPTVVLPDENAIQETTGKRPVTVKPQDDGQEEAEAPKAEAKQEQAAQPTQPQTQANTAKTTAPAVYTWPVKGEVLRVMNVEALAYDETMGDWRTHGGMDIAAGEGLKVLCVSDGVVEAVYQDDLMGATVVVNHQNGVVSTYSNLAQELAVEAGQEVDTGTVLGTVGATAIAESAMPSHLHLEMTENGQPVDPAAYLPAK